jgi:flavin-dependent dehydrogenase
VAGGGGPAPAGSATGILLAEGGVRVLVLDRARFPRPKICGEYLSPETARILDRLGVLPAVEGAGAVALRGMTITGPDGRRIAGTYPAAGPWRGYRDHALALPRAVLDRLLADRLRATSARLVEGVRVTDLVREGDRVAGVEARDRDGRSVRVRARLVVGADGRHSVVARRLGLVSPHPLRRMALTTYMSGPTGGADRGEIFVSPPDYSILNPLAPGRLNVSVVVPLEEAAAARGRLEAFFAARLARIPGLAARLAPFRRDAPVAALGPLAVRVAPPRSGGVLLVGDAAGFYDPFTGEGVYTALRGAELAADVAVPALRAGDCSRRALAAYAARRRAAFADKERVMRALQLVVRHRAVADRIAAVLVRRPDLLDLVMGVVGDFVPPRALLRRSPLLALGFTAADALTILRPGRWRAARRGAPLRREETP